MVTGSPSDFNYLIYFSWVGLSGVTYTSK